MSFELRDELDWRKSFLRRCNDYCDFRSSKSNIDRTEYTKKINEIANFLYFIGKKNNIQILNPMSVNFRYYKITNNQTLTNMTAKILPVKWEEFKKKFEEPTDDEKAFILLKSVVKKESYENRKSIFPYRYDMVQDLFYCYETDEAFCSEIEYD